MAIKHFGSCAKNKPIGNAKVTGEHPTQSLSWDQVPAQAPRVLQQLPTLQPPTLLGLPQEGPQPTQPPSLGRRFQQANICRSSSSSLAALQMQPKSVTPWR